MTVIELENVSTIYEGERIPAIRNVTLSIEQGEFLVVIGPNGAGKTTLLETINGLLRHTAGRVRVMGKDIGVFGNDIRKQIGYIPQEISFEDDTPFLVKDVVLMARFARIGIGRSPSAEDWNRVDEALAKVGMQEFKDKPIGKLSGGQQQKVMIARALAQDPEILLLDEPFSNLDFAARSELLQLICTLHESLHLTTLMVVHDFFAIPDICRRVLLMRKGEVIRDGSPEHVLQPAILNSTYGSLPVREVNGPGHLIQWSYS